MDVDRGNVNQFTDAQTWGVVGSPAFALREIGHRLAFASSRDGDYDIYTRWTISREVAHQLTDAPGYDGQPAWEPWRRGPGGEADAIAFVSDRDGDLDIYVMNTSGGRLRQLTDHPGRDQGPAWSPDGSRIAFMSDRDADVDIYVMDADGRNVRQPTDHSGGDEFPAWSPDGTQIAFASNRDGDSRGDIYVMDVNGGNVRQLTNDQHSNEDPTWARGAW